MKKILLKQYSSSMGISRYEEFRSKLFKLISALALFVLVGARGNAQLVVPSSNPDQTLSASAILPGPGLTAYNLSLNCDMLDLGGPIDSNKLWAIVFGDATTTTTPAPVSGIYMGLVDAANGSYNPLVIQIPDPIGSMPFSNTQANDPDIVLGNYIDAFSVTHYYVAVVYTGTYYSTTFATDLTSIYMESYEITWSYPNIYFGYHVGPILLSDTTNPATNTNPHIDLCADNTGFSSPPAPPATYVPYMHKFAVSWTQRVSLSNYGVFAVTGDLSTFSSSSTFSPLLITNSSWVGNDIACVHDPIMNNDYAYICYPDYPSGALKVTMWDLTSGGLGYVYTSSATGFVLPRIDAATIFDYNSRNGGTIWHAVEALNGSPDYIQHFGMGDYAAITPNPALWEVSDITYSPYKQHSAAICGTGNFLGGGAFPGKDMFTVGFYSDEITAPTTTYGDYYAYGVDNLFCAAGTVTPVTPGTYWDQVNYSNLNYDPGSCQDPVVAVANCTNTGYDVLVAWFDGDDCTANGFTGNSTGSIKYKFGGPSNATTYQYKPAFANQVKVNRHCTISPSPATDYIQISGMAKGDFEISDVLGQNVITGSINQDNSRVTIANLAAGMYIINLHRDSGDEKIKFVKN